MFLWHGRCCDCVICVFYAQFVLHSLSNASFQDYLEKQTRSKLLKANETADKLRRVQTTLVVDSTVIHSLVGRVQLRQLFVGLRY